MGTWELTGTWLTDPSHLVAETGMDPSMAIRKLKTHGFRSRSPMGALMLSLNINNVPICGPATHYITGDGSYDTHPDNPGIHQFVWEHFQGLNHVVQQWSIVVVRSPVIKWLSALPKLLWLAIDARRMGNCLTICVSRKFLTGDPAKMFLMFAHFSVRSKSVACSFVTSPTTPIL